MFIRHHTFQRLHIKIHLPGGVEAMDCMKNRRQEKQKLHLLSHMQGMFTTADQIYLNIFIIIQFEALLIILKMLLVLTT